MGGAPLQLMETRSKIVAMELMGTVAVMRKTKAIIESHDDKGFKTFSIMKFWLSCYLHNSDFKGVYTSTAKSISANSVSSMSTLELESFSPSQLTVLIVLMLLGGELFISMLLLLFTPLKKQLPTTKDEEGGRTKLSEETEPDQFLHQISSKFLLRVVSSYFLITPLLGYIILKIYFAVYPTSRTFLDRKGIHEDMFIAFTVVSSFANCGFLPTNENIMVFKNYSGILITVGILVLLGNTMYPVGLRLMLLALNNVSKKRELGFLLKDDRRKYLGYDSHLMSGEMEVGMLGVMVCAFIPIQAILLICLEWKLEGLNGMNSYQKVIGSLFMSTNSRHSGESTVDLSTISLAILVLFVVMMRVL